MTVIDHNPKPAQAEAPTNVIESTQFLALLTAGSTGIAVAFDVGYFTGIDINLFTLFTLSEHILFSIEALPYAFTLLVCVAFIFIFYIKANEILISKITLPARVSTRAIQTIVAAVMVTNVVYIRDLSFGIYNALLILYMLSYSTLHTNKSKQFLKISLVYIVLFFTSFYIGVIVSKTYSSIDAKPFHIIVKKDTAILDARIIRSGSRGVLFFDTKNKLISFLIWDSIEGIQKVDNKSP